MAFRRLPFDEYKHGQKYELLWCQEIYTLMTLQLLRKRSTLQDSNASEYRYKDEVVNPLLSSIFYDVEEALWMETGEIENEEQKQQRNFSKSDDECRKIGDKHDGILYMNVHGVKVQVVFLEVAGNAFAKNEAVKNTDLEKILRVMMLSLWNQYAHQEYESMLKLQSFGILVFGREFHFLSMCLVDNIYIVNEFDAFVIPNTGLCLMQIENAVKVVKKFKIRMVQYYRKLTEFTRKVTRSPSKALPTISPNNDKQKVRKSNRTKPIIKKK